MSDTLDLAAIKARAEAATPGPWVLSEPQGNWIWPHICNTYGSIRADAEHIAGMDPPTTLALAAEVERLTAERDALRAAVERVRCAVESMRFDIDEHARNYGVADQRFRDGLSHGWAKFIDLRAALAPADADAAS